MFQQKLLTKTFLATAMMGTIALTGCSKPAEKAETATSEPQFLKPLSKTQH